MTDDGVISLTIAAIAFLYPIVETVFETIIGDPDDFDLD